MPFPQWKIPDIGLESDKCLVQMLTADSIEWMSLYGFYKKGVLIFGGGLYDQPGDVPGSHADHRRAE